MENFKFIPYGRQDITEGDIEAIVKVLRSDFLTQGPAVPIFEQRLCAYTRSKYAVAVNSCTSALHIACLALELGPGDVLWTSPITFVASANCALYCGATVDFVDVDADNALMSVEKLKEKLEWAEKEGKLPKIVIPVHFAGQPCDMREIYDLSQQYDFKIIEDAAHAIGAKYNDEPVGNCRYSDITVFSFHPVKIITTGEGGVAITNSLQLAEKMKLLRSHGITRDPDKMHNSLKGPWYYEQIELGFNYRMTDIQAALGISQLDRLNHYISRRLKIVEWYDNQFKDMPISSFFQKTDRSSAHHLYVIMVNGAQDMRDNLYKHLYNSGIGVNIHYIPVGSQPFHRKPLKSNTVIADSIYSKIISLPIFPHITNNELTYIFNKVSSFLIKKE
mgnify:FL=1